MKIIKKWLSEYKEKSKNDRVNELFHQFKVAERNGCLWLTHNGVAFLKINVSDTSANIAGMLKTARDNAVEYEGL